MNPVETIKRIMPELEISTRYLDLIAYSTDASRERGEAVGVAFPKDSLELHKIVQLAKRFDIKVIIRGSGTNLVGAAVPMKSIVIDVSRLNRIIELKEGYVNVEAGVTLKELKEFLAKKGLEFPVYPLFHETQTIGGLIALDLAGKRGLDVGHLERWIESLTFIDGNSKMVELKNNLDHVLGRSGTTGVIVRAKLKVRKIADGRTYNILQFNTISVLMEKIKSLKNKTDVTMINYFSPFASEVLDLEPKHTLVVEYDSNRGLIREKDEAEEAFNLDFKLNSMLKSLGYINTVSAKVEEFDKTIYWLKKQNIPHLALVDTGHVVMFLKKSFDMKRLDSFLRLVGSDRIGNLGVGLANRDFISETEKKRWLLLKINYDPKQIFNKELI